MNGYTSAGALDRQPDLLARLQNVVRHLNLSDIRTVSALIAKLIGDQNAGLMAVRLLYWFPRSRKEGGWVYKSWRDWNAECNLSQAQVKRVHGKGLLETIGIERMTMKANGTPTVHYRVDENRLIQQLAEFLDTTPQQIQSWMCPKADNENGQEHLSQETNPDQIDQPNQPDEYGENDLIDSAETAKSITESNLHTKQHHNHQDNQQNSFAVVDIEKEEKEKLLQSLGKMGISYLRAKELIEAYGQERMSTVAFHAQCQKCTNPAGYVIRALKENWTFYSSPEKVDYALGNGLAYITGKYAAFINH